MKFTSMILVITLASNSELEWPLVIISVMCFSQLLNVFGKVEVGGAKKAALTSEKGALTGPCREDLKPHVKCHYSSLEVKVIISLRY